MQGLAQFMPARGGDHWRGSFQQVRAAAGPAGTERSVERQLGPLCGDIHLRFTLRVVLPDVRFTTAEDDDGCTDPATGPRWPGPDPKRDRPQ